LAHKKPANNPLPIQPQGQTDVHHIEQLLAHSKTQEGKEGQNAFDKLCSAGCDRKTLAELLSSLISTETIPLNPSKPRRNKSVKTKKNTAARSVSLRTLDSWETALDPQDGERAITIDQLDQIASRARKLLDDIARLKSTPLVNQLLLTGQIHQEDLLAGWLPQTVLFQGLIRLPELAKQFGPRERPDYDRLLTKLYTYIRDCTKGWHDEKLAEVLNALIPYDSEQPISEASLKKWRKRHKLIDKQGTRKR
jgi:hypothetical protein